MTKFISYLSDDTLKKFQELQQYCHLNADDMITYCIELTYEGRIKGTVVSKPIERKVSSLVMSILQQTLDRGESISIPSLGIVINPVGNNK